MPRLRDALKQKFSTPEEALRALGLDETLIEQEQKMSNRLLSRKGAVAKGALMAVLSPVLAADAKLNLSAVLAGLTAANFSEKKGRIAKAIHNVASKKLAKDCTLALDEVEKAMDVAEEDDEPEAKDDKEEMMKEGKDGKMMKDKMMKDRMMKDGKMMKDGMLPGKAALDSVKM